MAAFSKELPCITVWKGGVCGDFEFEEMVLVGIEVDGVDAAGRFEEVVENVVAGGGDSEYDVGGVNVEYFAVDCWVFPVECVDVFIVELLVFYEKFVVVYSPGVGLIERGREGQVGG